MPGLRRAWSAGSIGAGRRYGDACRQLAEHFAGQDTLTLAEFRDKLGTSRKYALALLEYWDKTKALKKDGDLRRAGPAFPALTAGML